MRKIITALFFFSVFSINTFAQELHTLRGHTSYVSSVSFSPDGTMLASGSSDGTIKLWRVATGKQLRTLRGHRFVSSVSFSPDGTMLASGGETIKLWRVATGKQLRTLRGHRSQVDSVSFSPDGRLLASGGLNETIKLWDVATGKQLRTLRGHRSQVRSVLFSPDGTMLASDSLFIIIWDVATGKQLHILPGGNSNVPFSPDGTMLAAGQFGGTIDLWDVATGKQLRTLTEHGSTVFSVSFSPDGTMLASGSADETIKLWALSDLSLTPDSDLPLTLDSVVSPAQDIQTSTFAQNTAPEYVVRVIYFVPKDREPAPNMDARLNTLIKDVQMFYADQMEAHGFGRKTFRFEADDEGNAVVHHLKGKFDNAYYQNAPLDSIMDELSEHSDTSKNIYLVADSSLQEYCGVASGSFAFMRAPGDCVRPWVAAHELGHTFGLWHDRRNQFFIMNTFENNYLTNDIFSFDRPIHIYNQLSKCAAQWLDGHHYFNDPQIIINEPTTIQMLPSSLVSPPNTIRLRFEVTDADGLHLVHLLTETTAGYPDNLVGCKLLNGESTVVEFDTTEITATTRIRLSIMDVNGNTAIHEFSVDITNLLPPSKAVEIPDAALEAAIREELEIPAHKAITQLDMMRLRRLSIDFEKGQRETDLTGLSDAANLKTLIIGHDSRLRDLSPLKRLTRLQALWIFESGQIKNLSPLAGLTQLEELQLSGNQISDLSPLTKLTKLLELQLGGNQIRDITPLMGLKELKSLRLAGNQIKDVRPLAELTNLKRLYIYNNPIENRKPLLALLQKNPKIKIYLKNNRVPLPVALSHFRAELTHAGVVLKWITESELDNAGFYIYRSETKDGEFKAVNTTLIQGAGTTSERNEYTWTDTTAKPNTVYYYRIEDVSHTGVRKQLATVRMRGLVSASGKLTTRWADLKADN